MNHVERFKALMNFQPVDRLPLIEWTGYWDKTVDPWIEQGLKYEGSLHDHFGFDPYWQSWFSNTGEGFPGAPYHGGPVMANEDDYEKLLPCMYPSLDESIEQMAPRAEAQERGDAVIWVTLNGYFWFPRGLFGIQPHMLAFYDYPELMHRINQDLVDHQIKILKKLAKVCPPCFFTFAEDMSYNHGPMLSKKLFDEFCAPYYRQTVPLMKQMGSVVIVDTDGDMTEMVPWLLEVGCDGILPLERQAGVDGNALRKEYPKLRMIGHYDKMIMHKGEQALRDEFERLLPLMKSGGFIPSVDHQTPPAVSLEDYRLYIQLLREYAKKAAE